jgi:hypothetical protein
MRLLLSDRRVRGAICTMQLQIANPDCHSTSGKTPQANLSAPHTEIRPICAPIVPGKTSIAVGTVLNETVCRDRADLSQWTREGSDVETVSDPASMDALA